MSSEKLIILVVDDETELAELIKEELEAENFQVAVAFDGVEALKYLKENPVDVVLSDIRMPNMNGVELMEIAKKLKPEVSFVLMSGYSDVSEKELKKKGGKCLLDKPLVWDKLLGVLNDSL